MPITYRIDVAQSLLESTYTGDVTMAEIREYGEMLVRESAFNVCLRALTIFDGMKSSVNSVDLVQHAEWRKRFPKLLKLAIVAPTNYEYGMARMYEMASDSVAAKEMRVFRGLKEARAWLGLPVTSKTKCPI